MQTAHEVCLLVVFQFEAGALAWRILENVLGRFRDVYVVASFPSAVASHHGIRYPCFGFTEHSRCYPVSGSLYRSATQQLRCVKHSPLAADKLCLFLPDSRCPSSACSDRSPAKRGSLPTGTTAHRPRARCRGRALLRTVWHFLAEAARPPHSHLHSSVHSLSPLLREARERVFVVPLPVGRIYQVHSNQLQGFFHTYITCLLSM